MNKKKTIISLCITCIIIYTGYFVLKTADNSDNTDSIEFIESYLGSESDSFSYSTISSVNTTDIESFTCSFDNKDYKYIKNDQGGWVCNQTSAITDKISVSYALNTIADIKIYEGEYIKIIEATNENLELCGLDNGFRIVLNLKDNSQITYTVGNYLEFGSAYYFTNGDGKIYTVLNRFTSAFESLCK